MAQSCLEQFGDIGDNLNFHRLGKFNELLNSTLGLFCFRIQLN